MEENIFESSSIPKTYLKLALPVVLGMVVTLVYNMVDTYFIALTGNTDLLAGGALCAPIFTLMLALGDSWGLGGSSLISRLLGGGQAEDGKRLSIFCFWGGIFTGLVTTCILLLGKGGILSFLGATPATLDYANQYYSWLALGAPFLILSLVPGNLLRTEGLPMPAMIGSILGAVINIILDPVFIFGLGMGAAGAAVATVIGYICSDLYFIWYVARKCPGLSMDLRKMRVNGAEVSAIMAIGLPASITNLMQSVGMTITNRSLLPYGNDAIAMMGITLKVVNIALLVLVGLAFGGQPLIGYTYGAKKMKRLKEILRFAYLCVCGTALVLVLILAVAARPVISVFMNEPSLVTMGAEMLRFQLAGMVFMGAGLIATITFQSTGKGLPALIVSLCRQGIVYFVVMMVMSAALGYKGVIGAQAVSDLVSLLIALILMKVYLGNELKEDH